MTRTRKLIIAAAVTIMMIAIAAFASRAGEPEEAVLTIRPETFRRSVTAEGVMEAVQSTPISAPREMREPMKIGWIAEDQAYIRAGEPIVRFDPTEFRDALLAGEKQRQTADNRMLKTSVDSNATQRNLQRDKSIAEREYEVADSLDYSNVEEVFSRYEVIESGLDKDLALGRRDHAQKMQAIKGDVSAAERQLLAIEQRKADFSIGRARAALGELDVTAPHDGILVLQRNWRGEIPRVGGNVFPGMPLAQIPKAGGMKAEVYVLEADFGGITEGQKAVVRLESDPAKTWKGTVTRVDKVAKPRFRNVPVQFFGVTVTLDEMDATLMKPGARVRATIELANEENAIVIPRQSVGERDGKRIVWKREDDKFVPVEITTGVGTAGRVLVTSGLEEGDVIALADPEAAQDDAAGDS